MQVEWKKVAGAVSYRLEIRDSQDRTVYSEKTSGTVLNVRLAVGEYSRRVVSIDKTGEEFASDWTPLLVISQTEHPNRIRLEWEKDNKADYYIAEIQNSDGKTVIRRKVRNTETEIDLPFGRYRKRILTVDRTGEMLSSSWTDLEIISKRREKNKYDIVKRSAAFPGWGQIYSASAYGFEINRLRGYSVMTLSSLFF